MSDAPPRRRLGETLALVLVCLVAAGIGFGSYRIWQQRSAAESAEVRPDLEFRDLDGKAHRLSEWDGKLLLLNFWATWCTPCTVEMPTLEALWREYGGRGLVVVGVSVDRDAPRAVLEPYIRNHGLTFPILLDPDSRIARAWRVTGIPATFVVRPGGEVAGMATGAREWNSAEMRALIETLLPSRVLVP